MSNLSKLDAFQVLKDVHDAPNNRLRVDAAITVNPPEALEVVIDHTNDSIQIGDGTDLLAVNADGSINVNLTDSVTRTTVSTFNEALAVASSVDTLITSYTVPVGKVAYLTTIAVSGTNIASYRILKNAATIERLYTYFGSSLNASANFSIDNASIPGLKFIAGDILTVRVEHSRPMVGDFSARIQVVEV